MKLKNIFSLMLVMAIGLFSSCSDESLIDGQGSGQGDTVPNGHAKVQFSFGGFSKATKSYAETIAPDGDSVECKIDYAMVFVFDGTGTDDTDEPLATAELQTIAKIDVASSDKIGFDYTGELLLITESGRKSFVIIANMDTTTIKEGITYAQFKNECTPLLDSLPKPPFYMYGNGNATLEATKTITSEITLTRLVSRIDISIRNSEANGATKPFELQAVRLLNTKNSSYWVWQNIDGSSFREPSNGIAGEPAWIDVTGDRTPGDPMYDKKILGVKGGRPDSLWHYLYAYETMHKIADADQVILQIKGLYDGKTAEYDIPITQAENTNIPARNLVRNHRYLVYVDSLTSTSIIGGVVVSDWVTGISDTIDVKPTVDMGNPVATIKDASSYAITYDSRSDKTFIADTIDINSDGELTINLVSNNLHSTFYSDVDWITATEITGYAETTSDTVKIPQQFKVVIDEYDAEGDDPDSRKGDFGFRNPTMKNKKHAFVVRQESGGPFSPTVTLKVSGSNVTGRTATLSYKGGETVEITATGVDGGGTTDIEYDSDFFTLTKGGAAPTQTFILTTKSANNLTVMRSTKVILYAANDSDKNKTTVTVNQAAKPSGIWVSQTDPAIGWNSTTLNIDVSNYDYTNNQSVFASKDANWVTDLMRSSGPTINNEEGTEDYIYMATIEPNNTYSDRTAIATFSNGPSSKTSTIKQNGAPEDITEVRVTKGGTFKPKGGNGSVTNDSVIVSTAGGEVVITLTDALGGYEAAGTQTSITKEGSGGTRTYRFTVPTGSIAGSSLGTIEFANTALGGNTKYTLHLAYGNTSAFPSFMPNWENHRNLSEQIWSTNFSCPDGYKVPTANEYLTISPPTSGAGAWGNTGTSTNEQELTGNNINIKTGPGYYIKGNESNTLYGIKRAGTDEAYVLEWKWVTGNSNGLTIRMAPGGKSLGLTSSAANIKEVLEAGSITTLKFPNHSSGTFAYYWSGTESGTGAWYFYVGSNYARLYSNDKTATYGVRCVLNN